MGELTRRLRSAIGRRALGMGQMLGAIMGIIATCAGCQTVVSGSSVEAERLSVIEWARIPGASVVIHNALTWRGLVASSSWEISAPLGWKDYLGRLDDRLSGYHAGPVDDRHASFGRLTAGDAYSLDVELLSPAPPVRARFLFTAMPD